MYPQQRICPRGKLRLQYECNPFAFIVEVAGAGQRTTISAF